MIDEFDGFDEFEGFQLTGSTLRNLRIVHILTTTKFAVVQNIAGLQSQQINIPKVAMCGLQAIKKATEVALM